MKPIQIAPTTPWIQTDFIDEDIKELFENQSVYMHNDPLIAQHIKLLRQLLDDKNSLRILQSRPTD